MWVQDAYCNCDQRMDTTPYPMLLEKAQPEEGGEMHVGSGARHLGVLRASQTLSLRTSHINQAPGITSCNKKMGNQKL
jgi:hypothetical protein